MWWSSWWRVDENAHAGNHVGFTTTSGQSASYLRATVRTVHGPRFRACKYSSRTGAGIDSCVPAVFDAPDQLRGELDDPYKLEGRGPARRHCKPSNMCYIWVATSAHERSGGQPAKEQCVEKRPAHHGEAVRDHLVRRHRMTHPRERRLWRRAPLLKSTRRL